MRTVKSIKGHHYNGKFRAPGAVYKAKEEHARMMVYAKNIIYFEEPKPKRQYTRRNMAANKPAGYQTKDMAPE